LWASCELVVTIRPRAHGEEGAGQAAVDQALPLAERQLVQRHLVAGDAGVGDADVQVAQVRDSVGHGLRDLLLASDVRLQRYGALAQLLRLVRDGTRGVQVLELHDRQVRALAGERLADRAANARPAARHECRAPLKSSHRSPSTSSSRGPRLADRRPRHRVHARRPHSRTPVVRC
jgi:hypothetical protein